METKHITKDGEIRDILVSARTITLHRRSFIQSILSDITEHKRVEEALRESELRYRTLFESAPVGIGVATFDWQVLACNNTMLQMTGYSEAEIQQINLRDSYQNPEERALLLKQLQTDRFVRDLEVELKRRDGAPCYASLTIMPFILDGEDVILTVQKNITERKRVEEALQRHQEQLRRQRDELESFAFTIAHDLKGKLQVIALYNELTESEHSSKIAEQIQDISAFLEKLLLLAKKGEILGELSEIDLNSLLKEISGKISFMDPKLEINIKKLPSIVGDPIKLNQVFENLLINVVKHAVATKVEIFSKENTEEYRIFIRDNGKGISKEKQQEILESWSTKSYTHLGLMIVMKIVQAHKGNITFYSREGKGTIFTIHFPKKIRN